MNLNDAYNNLNQLLMFGRITMPNGSLTGQEHSELFQNLQLLYDGAKENQETKQAAKEKVVEEK